MVCSTNIPSAPLRPEDKRTPYHWLDFAPPQPQIAAAPVEDFVTAAHSFNSEINALGGFSGGVNDPTSAANLHALSMASLNIGEGSPLDAISQSCYP